MPVVMGTAGHIDHGKTTLVKILTGVDCDRLEEEKKRGITIELGFAFLDLPDNSLLSIVDVPGHEKFVKNMVSGAAGIDFVVLVIAADEGVMPQTREHLAICNLLGVRHGIVALTKTDMVDDDWLQLVTEDIKNFLQGSFLEGAEIYPVSAQRGTGVQELKAALFAMAKNFAPHRRADLPRLPVDRVFSIKGHGTVVTGTLVSGAFSLGDELCLMPKGAETKVRSLQSHGKSVELAPAGYRTAVNLSSLEVDDIQRGDVLTRKGALFNAASWIMQVNCLESSPRALKNRGEVHFHHGAKEVQAKLYFWDRDKLQPGESALCQVRFEEPMVGVFADRSVIRSFAPLQTVAGAKLIYPLDFDLRRKQADFDKRFGLLQQLATFDDYAPLAPGTAGSSPQSFADEILSVQLALAGENGVSLAQLCVLTDIEMKQLEKNIALMGSKQEAFQFDKEARLYIGRSALDTLYSSLVTFFAGFHAADAMKSGISRSEVSSSWGKGRNPKLINFILERALKQESIVVDGDVLRLKTHTVSVAGSAATLKDALLAAYQSFALTPPNLKEVLAEQGSTIKEAAPVLKLLQESGELIKLNEEIYYAAAHLQLVQEKAREWFKSNENLGLAELKELTGLSRKYLIAILEYFDKSKLTIRVGDKRVLR